MPALTRGPSPIAISHSTALLPSQPLGYQPPSSPLTASCLITLVYPRGKLCVQRLGKGSARTSLHVWLLAEPPGHSFGLCLIPPALLVPYVAAVGPFPQGVLQAGSVPHALAMHSPSAGFPMPSGAALSLLAALSPHRRSAGKGDLMRRACALASLFDSAIHQLSKISRWEEQHQLKLLRLARICSRVLFPCPRLRACRHPGERGGEAAAIPSAQTDSRARQGIRGRRSRLGVLLLPHGSPLGWGSPTVLTGAGCMELPWLSFVGSVQHPWMLLVHPWDATPQGSCALVWFKPAHGSWAQQSSPLPCPGWWVLISGSHAQGLSKAGSKGACYGELGSLS